jgi:hypothetical protein
MEMVEKLCEINTLTQEMEDDAEKVRNLLSTKW